LAPGESLFAGSSRAGAGGGGWRNGGPQGRRAVRSERFLHLQGSAAAASDGRNDGSAAALSAGSRAGRLSRGDPRRSHGPARRHPGGVVRVAAGDPRRFGEPGRTVEHARPARPDAQKKDPPRCGAGAPGRRRRARGLAPAAAGLEPGTARVHRRDLGHHQHGAHPRSLPARSAAARRRAARHWKTSTFVAALRSNGITAPFVIDCAINGTIFRTYVEKVLAPTLAAGDIVVIDTLASHKVEGVREAIEARGACVLYLPPYSPDFNPIDATSSPSSKNFSEPPQHAPSKTSGPKSAASSTASPHTNAPTTSPIADIASQRESALLSRF
jgi:DDE superfamily endonuclease